MGIYRKSMGQAERGALLAGAKQASQPGSPEQGLQGAGPVAEPTAAELAQPTLVERWVAEWAPTIQGCTMSPAELVWVGERHGIERLEQLAKAMELVERHKRAYASRPLCE